MEATLTLMDHETFAHRNEAKLAVGEQIFATSVQKSLQNYFSQLEGAEPVNLYNLVLAEMEVPLLKMVMRFTNGNQSKAAKILGISRGTLRKKLAMHELN